MAGRSPNAGEVDILTQVLSIDHILELYSNNYTPVEGSVVGNFTAATATGYAAETLSGGAWNVVSGDPTVGTHTSTKTFTGTGVAQTVYGYFIRRTSNNVVRWARRFDTALTLGLGSPPINILAKVSLKDTVD
jgi:hypothetical protein